MATDPLASQLLAHRESIDARGVRVDMLGHGEASCARSPASSLLSTLVIPVPPAGQARPDVGTWPVSWTPPPARPRVLPEQALAAPQQRRLPVYDDAGEPIPLSEIEARIDPSGMKGAFWAGLIGVAAGVAIVDQTGSPRPDIADRILEEPLFGNRYVLGRLLETRPDG